MDLLEINNSFNIGDKVRILKKDEDPDSPKWRTAWFGIITKLGTKFALIADLKRTDSNVGTFQDSSEWCPYESKMLKIIKD